MSVSQLNEIQKSLSNINDRLVALEHAGTPASATWSQTVGGVLPYVGLALALAPYAISVIGQISKCVAAGFSCCRKIEVNKYYKMNLAQLQQLANDDTLTAEELSEVRNAITMTQRLRASVRTNLPAGPASSSSSSSSSTTSVAQSAGSSPRRRGASRPMSLPRAADDDADASPPRSHRASSSRHRHHRAAEPVSSSSSSESDSD